MGKIYTAEEMKMVWRICGHPTKGIGLDVNGVRYTRADVEGKKEESTPCRKDHVGEGEIVRECIPGI